MKWFDVMRFAGRNVDMLSRAELDRAHGVGFEYEAHATRTDAKAAPHVRADPVRGQ